MQWPMCPVSGRWRCPRVCNGHLVYGWPLPRPSRNSSLGGPFLKCSPVRASGPEADRPRVPQSALRGHRVRTGNTCRRFTREVCVCVWVWACLCVCGLCVSGCLLVWGWLQVPNRHQIVTKSSPNRHQIVTKSSPNRHQIVTKSSPNRHQIVTKSTPNRHQCVCMWLGGWVCVCVCVVCVCVICV